MTDGARKPWVVETDLKRVRPRARAGVEEVEEAGKAGLDSAYISGVEGTFTPGMVEKSEMLQRLEAALDRDGLTIQDLGKGRAAPEAVRSEFLRMKDEEERSLRDRGAVSGPGSRQVYVGIIWGGEVVLEDSKVFLEDFNYFPRLDDRDLFQLPPSVLDRQRTLRLLCWARNAVALAKMYRTFSRPFPQDESRDTRLIVAWEGTVTLGAGGLHSSADAAVQQGIETIDAAIAQLRERQGRAGVPSELPASNLGVN